MRTMLVPAVFFLMTFTGPVEAQRRGAGAGGPVTFAVAVSNPSGAPLADVKVTMTGPVTRSTRTEGGRTVFEGVPAGAYVFRFEKTGYVPLEREVTGRGGKPIDVKVTLTAVPLPPPKPVDPLPPEVVTTARIAVLDMPAFIEKNYVGRAAGKTTAMGCAAGGGATLIQINEPVAQHAHDAADEFIYVIAGQGVAKLDGRQESLGPAVFLMIPRGMPHTLNAGPKKPLVLMSVLAGEKCGG